MYRSRISGRQNSAILADFLPQLPAQEATAFSEEKEATFRKLAKGNLQPLPGLLHFLAQIKKQGLPAAVVTNVQAKMVSKESITPSTAMMQIRILEKRNRREKEHADG